jgi:hypothetical protein
MIYHRIKAEHEAKPVKKPNKIKNIDDEEVDFWVSSYLSTTQMFRY